jgi:hypothetical protein
MSVFLGYMRDLSKLYFFPLTYHVQKAFTFNSKGTKLQGQGHAFLSLRPRPVLKDYITYIIIAKLFRASKFYVSYVQQVAITKSVSDPAVCFNI